MKNHLRVVFFRLERYNPSLPLAFKIAKVFARSIEAIFEAPAD